MASHRGRIASDPSNDKSQRFFKRSRAVQEECQRRMPKKIEIDEKWGASLGIECTVQLFSSLKKQGVDDAETIIGKWLNTPVNHIPNFVA